MSVKPFIEHNPAIDEYTPSYNVVGKGLGVPGAFGLFMPSGWCVLGIQFIWSKARCGNRSMALIVCNIAVGLWNDPD